MMYFIHWLINSEGWRVIYTKDGKISRLWDFRTACDYAQIFGGTVIKEYKTFVQS